MKKLTRNLFAVGILATSVLAGCSSETTTGVDSGNTNTEDTQTDMDENMTDTTTTDMPTDTSSQNQPAGTTGNQDQN